MEEVVGSEVREEREAHQVDIADEVQVEEDQLIEADPLQSPPEHKAPDHAEGTFVSPRITE